MRWLTLAGLAALILANLAAAGRYFADVTAADPQNGTVVYTITHGKDRGKEVKARLTKDCVIKEGYYRLGKPAVTREGDGIADGLKNPVFRKATAEKPLRVNIYTADQDDPGSGIKRGDVTKILVNPPPRRKK